ncbi:MAG: tetratricopeptide repeat protein [Planctomycetota bacterium]|nr:tetratricopeptide repeat protein [Planctomycetota bacterium]
MASRPTSRVLAERYSRAGRSGSLGSRGSYRNYYAYKSYGKTGRASAGRRIGRSTAGFGSARARSHARSRASHSGRARFGLGGYGRVGRFSIYFSLGWPYYGYSYGYPYYSYSYYGCYPYYGYYYPYYCTPYYYPRAIFFGAYRYPVYGYYNSYYYPYYYPYAPYDRTDSSYSSSSETVDPEVEWINQLIEAEEFEKAARALFRRGDYDLAAEFFKKAIYKEGDSATVEMRLRLGVAYFASGDTDLADVTLRAGLGRGIPAEPMDVGSLYGNPEDFADQLQALKAKSDGDPEDVSARFTYAFLSLQRGDTGEARSALEVVTRLDPDDSVSRALLESITE